MAETHEDFYALLGISFDSSEKQIATAYRQKALKVHPDKNPNNKAALKTFHELTIAYDILQDPVKKSKHDALIRGRHAKVLRDNELNAHRRKLRDDLLAREAVAVNNKQRNQNDLQAQLDRLRRESRKHHDSHIKQMKSTSNSNTAPSSKSHQITMTLKWQRSTHPLLTREVLEDALKSYAPIDHLIISDSKTRAVLLVSSDEHARQVLSGCNSDPKLYGIQITQMKAPNNTGDTSRPFDFPIKPTAEDPQDYESITLRRMKHAGELAERETKRNKILKELEKEM